MTNLLIVFTVLSIINVIFSTVRSLVTVKGGAFAASLISALYFGYYNVVLIYTVADFPLWQKVVITFATNLVGVYVVKWAEKKAQKDKLWKVEATIPRKRAANLVSVATEKDLSFNYVDIGKYYLFNFYCPTQKDSAEVKQILNEHGAKYFVSESKNL